MGLLAAKKAGVAVGEASISRAKDFVRCSTDFSGSEAIDLILAERVIRTPPCHRANELQLDGVD